MISMLSLFECILRSLLLSTEEIKLFAIVGWIFYLSDSLKLFMISFKYGLILLRCSSTDSILFLSLLVPYSIQLLLQNVLLLPFYNNFLFHPQRDSQYL